jgi:hypothetical protein
VASVTAAAGASVAGAASPPQAANSMVAKTPIAKIRMVGFTVSFSPFALY